MRAVLDTNVIISGFISRRGAPGLILERWRQGAFELLVSQAILDEYQRMFHYGHLQPVLRMTEAEIVEAVERFRRLGELVEAEMSIDAVEEDPDDNVFLGCAVAGGADVIVSGDPHLRQLRSYEGIHIFTPAAFLALLAAEDEASDP
jgi:putative PIN family toxin of toxin-antitoxin system